jgi:drug/metabolite transporter (DMT)-like permease
MTYRKLLIFSFFFNGLLMVGMKAVDGFKLEHFLPVILFMQYTLGTALGLPMVLRAKKPISRAAVWIGVLGGITSAIGMGACITAVGIIPGYIVFPVIQGGTLLAGVLFGMLVFRERVGPFGVAGIVAGTAAIVVLSR